MATFRPLYIGARPVVVEMPYWLYSDRRIGGAFDALARSAGAQMTTVKDRSVLVGILRAAAFDDPAVARAHAALADEMTVWRLSTRDGAKRACPGDGSESAAYSARSYARERGAA